MTATPDEISRRSKAALDAIRAAFATEDDESDAALFVTHHLDELDADYWHKHLGTSEPEPARVLDILALRSHWSDEDEDGVDVFDFTLPGDVTDYVISVRFDSAGEIEGISMES